AASFISFKRELGHFPLRARASPPTSFWGDSPPIPRSSFKKRAFFARRASSNNLRPRPACLSPSVFLFLRRRARAFAFFHLPTPFWFWPMSGYGSCLRHLGR